MDAALDEPVQTSDQHRSTACPDTSLLMGLVLLLNVTMAPTLVEASSFSAGAIDDPTVPVTCSNAVMTSAPKFLSAPKGAAKYPFSMKCTSPKRPGLMIFTWEGSWNPAETRQDRPNAVESLFIEGYEPFIPGRTGGRLFMYWTARCTADPWLQGGTCHRYGGYVPDDLRAAFPNIDARTFPLTENRISPALRQQLIKQYQEANQPPSSAHTHNVPPQQSMTNQAVPKPSQSMAGSVSAPAAKMETPLGSGMARSRIFRRGIDSADPEQAASQDDDAELAISESSGPAILEVGRQEKVEPTTFTLNRSFHVIGPAGEIVVIEAGVYEIETIMDVQLGIAKEKQPTILLPANPSTHSEPLKRPLALVIPGMSHDALHLVLLKPDGRRFDIVGSASGVQPRSIDPTKALPDSALKDAIGEAMAQPSSGPSPLCHPNPSPIGPRWIPVPCAMPTIPGTSITSVP